MENAPRRKTKSAPAGSNTLFVGSLEKGIRVLEAFDEDHPVLGITEIAQITGIDKSAAQRFSNTLHQLGLLEKDPVTRRYRPAKRLVQFAFTYLRHNGLGAVAMPRLISAGSRFQTTVNLAEREEADIIYTIRIPQQNAHYLATVPGRRMPMYRTAPGLSILARLPDEEIEEVIERSTLFRKLPTSIATPEEIWQAVQRTRAAGYCITYEQNLPREISVAAAIVNHHGRPFAAVQIPAYTPHWTLEDAEKKLAPLAMETADAISGAFIASEGEL